MLEDADAQYRVKVVIRVRHGKNRAVLQVRLDPVASEGGIHLSDRGIHVEAVDLPVPRSQVEEGHARAESHFQDPSAAAAHGKALFDAASIETADDRDKVEPERVMLVDAHVLGTFEETQFFHGYTNFILPRAKAIMRSSSRPWRQRSMLVAP